MFLNKLALNKKNLLFLDLKKYFLTKLFKHKLIFHKFHIMMIIKKFTRDFKRKNNRLVPRFEPKAFQHVASCQGVPFLKGILSDQSLCPYW